MMHLTFSGTIFNMIKKKIYWINVEWYFILPDSREQNYIMKIIINNYKITL